MSSLILARFKASRIESLARANEETAYQPAAFGLGLQRLCALESRR